MFILKHKWHPEHRKCLFQSTSGIWNIEDVCFKPQMASATYKIVILKHKWHPEHRKFLFHSGAFNKFPGGFGGVWELCHPDRCPCRPSRPSQNIENVYFLKHKWHPENRKLLFQSVNGIQNMEMFILKT